jgi:hypothetical protein
VAAAANVGSSWLCASERRDRTLLAPIEKPSARRFAKPRMRTTAGDSEASDHAGYHGQRRDDAVIGAKDQVGKIFSYGRIQRRV